MVVAASCGGDVYPAAGTERQANLTELERICREGEKLPKYRCAKLVVSYQIILKSVFEYFCKCNIFLANISKIQFLLCHYGITCVDW